MKASAVGPHICGDLFHKSRWILKSAAKELQNVLEGPLKFVCGRLTFSEALYSICHQKPHMIMLATSGHIQKVLCGAGRLYASFQCFGA